LCKTSAAPEEEDESSGDEMSPSVSVLMPSRLLAGMYCWFDMSGRVVLFLQAPSHRHARRSTVDGK
jgi:hypothetical protein